VLATIFSMSNVLSGNVKLCRVMFDPMLTRNNGIVKQVSYPAVVIADRESVFQLGKELRLTQHHRCLCLPDALSLTCPLLDVQASNCLTILLCCNLGSKGCNARVRISNPDG